jgi:CBS-domain-containing membrane protein
MNNASHQEKLVSGLGGTVSILVVYWITQYFEQGLETPSLLVASVGASAVLLFAAPHSPLSQPWNVVGGHIVSALIGVTIYQQLSDPIVGGSLAVGLAIITMYYLKCLHPPGGATALIPFIDGDIVESFGIVFALLPVGLGAVAMVLIAVAFNYPFKHRRYPLALFSLANDQADATESGPAYPDISHADLVVALSEIDTYVDISEEDLLRIYEIASRRSHPSGSKR